MGIESGGVIFQRGAKAMAMTVGEVREVLDEVKDQSLPVYFGLAGSGRRPRPLGVIAVCHDKPKHPEPFMVLLTDKTPEEL